MIRTGPEQAREGGGAGASAPSPPPGSEGALPVAHLVPDPALPPAVQDEAWLEALQASLAAEGQIEPLRVRPPAKPGGPWRVHHGRARLEVARRLGWKTLEVRMEDCPEDREALYRHVAANETRTRSAVEEAWLVDELVRAEEAVEPRGAQARVAKRLLRRCGRGSAPTVSRHVRIARAFAPAALRQAGVAPAELAHRSQTALYRAAGEVLAGTGIREALDPPEASRPEGAREERWPGAHPVLRRVLAWLLAVISRVATAFRGERKSAGGGAEEGEMREGHGAPADGPGVATEEGGAPQPGPNAGGGEGSPFRPGGGHEKLQPNCNRSPESAQ